MVDDLSLKKGNGATTSSSKKLSYGKKEAMQYPVLPSFSCGGKKWVRDCVIPPSKVEFLSSIVDEKDAR